VADYAVLWRPAALRQLKKLAKPLQEKIKDAVDGLASEPKPAGVRTLANHPQFWRLKVDNFRVIYAIDEGVLTVLVLKVAHRRDAYRQLERLG